MPLEDSSAQAQKKTIKRAAACQKEKHPKNMKALQKNVESKTAIEQKATQKG